jgi:hypothetical protein
MSKISQATKAKRDQDAFFIKLVQEREYEDGRKSADNIRDTSWGVFKSRLRKYDELKKTVAADGKFTEVSILLGCFNCS